MRSTIIVVCIVFANAHLVLSQNGVGVNTLVPKSSFEDNGSFGKKVSSINSNTTLDETYGSVLCNTNAFTVTLPIASDCAFRVYEIKRAIGNTNTITIDVTSAGTIDGAASYLLSKAGQSITVFSDGSVWLLRDGSGEGDDWSLKGNAGTVPATNFVGTTDAQDFVVRTTNAERIRVLAAGNVGINTNNPTSQLHVVGDLLKTANYAAALISNAATSTTNFSDKKGLEITTSGAWSGTNSASIGLHVSSVTGGTNNYDAIFNGGGNVGIATGAPTAKLHVAPNSAQTIDNTGTILSNYVSSSTNGIVKKALEIISIGTWNGTSASNIGIHVSNIQGGSGASGTNTGILVSNVVGGANNYDAIFNGGGNVGIGMANPTSKLQIAVSGNQTADYAGTLLTNTTTSTTNSIMKKGLEVTSTGNWSGTSATNVGIHVSNIQGASGPSGVNMGLYISSVTGGTTNYDAIFNGGGNVGIGTITPGSKLEVVSGGAGNVLTLRNTNVAGYTSIDFFDNTGAFALAIGAANAATFIPNIAYIGANNRDLLFTHSGDLPDIYIDAVSYGVLAKVGIGTKTPQQSLSVLNGLNIDQQGINFGTILNTLTFGSLSNEGIGSNRSGGGTNPAGLDFFTNATNKMCITNAGRVGIGTTLPQQNLSIQNGVNIDQANGNSGNTANALLFGAFSGEGIGSNRSGGGVNPWGIDFYTGFTNKMVLTQAGNVGLGCTDPQYRLHVEGDIASSGTVRTTNAIVTGAITACSDIRYKENIKGLSNSLDNILKLNGVSYNWKSKSFPEKHFTSNNQIGFIAQELEKIYPELVLTDSDGYKSVDYTRITPILVEALKEFRKEFILMREEIAMLKSKIK